MANRVIEILITGNSDQAIKEIEKLVGTTEAAQKNMSKSFSDFGKYATIAVAGAATAIAAFSVKAALSFEDAHARMVNAIKNTGGSLDEFSGRIQRTEKNLENLGFSNTETEGALATLTRVTKDTGQALGLMGLAADIARGRHTDLATATLLLTKVESGHVALLGRLGINTKDAEGNTISATEAIKRLSEMYGGQAKTSAETFGGQLEVLKAKATDLGIQIGSFLIPKVAAVAGALADSVSWLVKHKEAAIALAVVIGGPLVASMVTWIATMAVAKVEAMVSAIQSMYLQFLYLTDAIAAADLAALGFVAAFAGVLALGVAIGYILGGLTGSNGPGTFGAVTKELAKGQDAGKRWGETLVNNALATKAPLESLRFELAAVRMEQANAAAAYKAGGMSVQEATNAYGRYSAAIKALKTQIASTSAEQRKALADLQGTAKALGVDLPGAAKQSATELKALKTAVAEVPPVFGDLTQSVLNLKLSSDELKAFTKDTQNMENAVNNSMTSSTDAFAHFGDQASVSEEEFQTFFQQSITDSALWAQELQDLIKRGVDKGIVGEIAQAGPKSKPALDAFREMVDLNGVDVVNSWYQTGENSRKVMVEAIATMQVDVEEEVQRIKAQRALDAIMIPIQANWDNFWANAPESVRHPETFFGVPAGYASGGPVYAAAGFAARGTDTVPAMLTPGEYVVPKNGALVLTGGGGGGGTYTIPISLYPNSRAVAEVTISEVNKPGGPKISSRAIDGR